MEGEADDTVVAGGDARRELWMFHSWLSSIVHTPGFLTPQQSEHILPILAVTATIEDLNSLKGSILSRDFLTCGQIDALFLQLCGNETDG